MTDLPTRVMSVPPNATLFNASALTVFPPTTTPNFWPDFGPLQYVEVIYLTIVTVLGTIGNLVVIFSIALERRVHAHGNIFIINLAIADLIVSAVLVPTVIANVIKTENALSEVFCDVIAFLVTTTCTCSLCNLMFIAINRYWAVVRSSTYQKTFSRSRVYYMVSFTWLWSILVVSPTLYGWGGLKFDPKMMVCSWDDVISLSYTWFITVIAIFIPLCIIAFCYFQLFTTVRGSGRWVRSLSIGSGISQNSEQHRRSMRKERSLMRTLLTTVLLFCLCWVPFGAAVLINPSGTPAHAKKIFGWLALTNSCVNFVIYGAMNPVFRRGYHNLFVFIFRCKSVQRISSTIIHGSFSDSSRTIKRQKENQILNGKGKTQSRSDTITALQTASANNTPLMIHNPNMRTVEPSPLVKENNSEAPATITQQKKGIVESIRRASLLRKGRPRLTSDVASKEEDRQWRAKRNSAMLLQIQMGDDNSDEEFARNQDDRYSRRTVSDSLPKTKRQLSIENQQQENDNSHIRSPKEEDAFILDLEEITKSCLRGNWMPENAVYASRRNTPVLERSNTPLLERSNTNPDVLAKINSSPIKKSIQVQTVSGNIENTHDPSPEDIGLNELNGVLPPISPDSNCPLLDSLALATDKETLPTSAMICVTCD